VLGTMLEHALELRAMHSDMLAGKWRRAGRNAAPEARHGDLLGKHVGIVGFGEIAQAVASRAAAFGMSVSAVARSRRDKTPYPARLDRHASRIAEAFGRKRLPHHDLRFER